VALTRGTHFPAYVRPYGVTKNDLIQVLITHERSSVYQSGQPRPILGGGGLQRLHIFGISYVRAHTV